MLWRCNAAARIDEEGVGSVIACIPCVAVDDDHLADLCIRDKTTSLSAALADDDYAGSQIDVVVPQSGELRDADASSEEEFGGHERGEADEVTDGGMRQHACQLCTGAHSWQLPRKFDTDACAAKGIVGNMPRGLRGSGRVNAVMPNDAWLTSL